MAGAVRLEGLVEFQRALAECSRTLARELHAELLAAGEPVARTAQALAVQRIPKMTEPWSDFRVGSTTALVYVAPKQRGTRITQRKRKNFAEILMTSAMEPALAANETLIGQRAQVALDRVLDKAGF